ncbi:hypothetical protein CRE_27811 [Caenorhabditis remanei]|uniref:F-box domain-containing protein n=1 Tax=Caenorhabditis remanei TaxID=31234 RepID=E3N5H0_CAERE|nr:hypothetical protein CRE_27811 [Caenorhabditis remanei]
MEKMEIEDAQKAGDEGEGKDDANSLDGSLWAHVTELENVNVSLKEKMKRIRGFEKFVEKSEEVVQNLQKALGDTTLAARKQDLMVAPVEKYCKELRERYEEVRCDGWQEKVLKLMREKAVETVEQLRDECEKAGDENEEEKEELEKENEKLKENNKYFQRLLEEKNVEMADEMARSEAERERLQKKLEEMSALPILKLPIIVLMKILKTIDIDTVILISLCSRKMYHLVKNFRDKSVTLRIEIYGRDSYVRVVTPNGYHEVEVMSGEKEDFRNLEQLNINGHLVPIDRSRKHDHVWETYWDDKVEGLHSVMEYISDLFGIKIVTKITVSLGTMRLLDVLKERQRNVFELATYFRLNEKESHLILDNYPAKVIRISGLPHNFPIGKYLQTVDSLTVNSKVLITLDDLLKMNCVDLFLSRNRFTGTEIKRLLQHWAIGGFKRLKYLELDVEDLNMEDVFGELTHSQMTENRTYK